MMSTIRVATRSLAAGLLLLLAATPVLAQSVLFVRVRSGVEPVAGASVELHVAGHVFRQASTDPQGAVRLGGLPAGTYEVHANAIGYESFVSDAIRLELGDVEVLEVQLETAPVELESIAVTVDRVTIERTSTEFSSSVDDVAIELLPLAHETSQLVALTPGARPGYVWGGANFQANNYRLDGLSANHPGLGGDLIQPSVNWIERLEVRGLGAGAEYGGFQGGLVDVTTKRGGNDFGATIRTNVENDALNASNLVATEIGTEVAERYDVEGEVRGPVLRDRLFYYLSGRHVVRDGRALNHLGDIEGRYTPYLEERTEDKLFGKLTWTPNPADRLEASAGYIDTRAQNFNTTGYEAPGATHRYASPTWFGNISWHHLLGSWGTLEARVSRFARDERYDPYGGDTIPGVRRFALTPPFTSYQNAPFTLRSAPSSTSGTLIGTIRLRAGDLEHVVKAGAEYNRGSFFDERRRNGGLTWMPTGGTMDPSDPATWSHTSASWVASQWGGEVYLDADVVNAAAFVQSALSLGPRIVFSPGLRWNLWQGMLTPRNGERFKAVEDRAVDPRVGLTVELSGDGSFVVKGHWGRYHQDLISQMFDRAEGADVFTNEEIWYYRGDRFSDPATRFTEAERDALAEEGLFTRESVVVLNETGRVMGYRQPYVSQWLVGLEKSFENTVKLELLYARRTNHDMVALVDLNRNTNYTRFRNVRVYDSSGQILPFVGGSVFLDEVYIPNFLLLERLRCKANTMCPDMPMPPDLTFADTLDLTWNPVYVLTTAPDGRREFGQLQFNVEVARPTWGATLSLAATALEGNLDNVSGYADPEEYSAGPYVRVNEGVNNYGILPNFAEREVKASVWGMLPWRLRGGLFWTFRSGDHYSPRFRLSGMGFYRYRANAGALTRVGGFGVARSPGDILDYKFFWPMEGHNIFVGPRGEPQLERRANVDLRLERRFELREVDLALSLDLFNVFGVAAPEELNTMVNHGKNYYYFMEQQYVPGTGVYRIPANQFYQAVLDRVPPRTLRLGVIAYF